MSDDLISDWCQRHLGAPVAGQFFGLQRLSSVHGVRLRDGREVVLKVRDDEPRLQACSDVHRALWQAGIPCPEPLVGPLPLMRPGSVPPRGQFGEGLEDPGQLAVNAEQWLGTGYQAVAPAGPQGYANLFARMVAAAPPADSVGRLDPVVPWLRWDHGDPDRIWPPAMSDRWDPHRIIAEIPGHVVRVAVRSRERLLAPDVRALPVVVGHGDFEAQNCRWVPDGHGGERLVVHDWDSVVAMPEAVLAGNSAFNFVSEDDCAISSLEDNDEFLAAYALARGRDWSQLELEVAYATGVWVGAYNAAFEHLKGGPGPVTVGLAEQAEERLRRAGA